MARLAGGMEPARERALLVGVGGAWRAPSRQSVCPKTQRLSPSLRPIPLLGIQVPVPSLGFKQKLMLLFASIISTSYSKVI